MKWDYWTGLYLATHCTARGLRPKTIEAYGATLTGFRNWIRFRSSDKTPDEVTAKDVLDYVTYLRRERENGDAAVNRTVTVLKNFYRAMVAMEQLEPGSSPLEHFPKMKGSPRRLPQVLSSEEVVQLLSNPRTDTVIGLRDRAILFLLYGTAIRASECAGLLERDVDLVCRKIQVRGKGGHERSVPLNEEVVEALKSYREARGELGRDEAVFRSRKGRGMSRNAIYERVRTHGRRARIEQRVSPHRLRHTCATHLVRAGVKLTVIRALLGHRLITSTQIYIHTTAEDLREAAARHPVGKLVARVEPLLPGLQLAFQSAPRALYG
jgi:site-specific recombinase XerD